MKAKEVLEILNITRPTLSKYVKEGLIAVDSEINGQYNYNEESVNKLLGITVCNNETVPDSKIQTIVQIENLLIDIFYQLAGMKLLTSDSIMKLKKANDLFKTLEK